MVVSGVHNCAVAIRLVQQNKEKRNFFMKTKLVSKIMRKELNLNQRIGSLKCLYFDHKYPWENNKKINPPNPWIL